MTKGRVISVIVLLAVCAGFYAGYEFFLKKQLETYSANKEEMKNLQVAYDDLVTTFEGMNPESYSTAWSAEVEPWKETLADRSQFFTIEDWYTYESPGDDKDIMLRFWYKDKSQAIIDDLYQKGVQKLGFNFLTPDLRTQFSVPYDTDWAGLDVTREMVDKSMERLSFAVSATEFLLQQDLVALYDISIWPKFKHSSYNNMLELQRIGLVFSMTMENLVAFVEELRTAERYYSIEAIKVEYPYIAYNQQPVLQVQMVLSMAGYDEKATAPASGAQARGGSTPPGGFNLMRNRRGDDDDDRSSAASNNASTTDSGGIIGWFKGLFGK